MYDENLCMYDGFNLKNLSEYKKRCTKHRENANVVFRLACVWWVYLKDLFYVAKSRENAKLVFRFVCVRGITSKNLFDGTLTPYKTQDMCLDLYV